MSFETGKFSELIFSNPGDYTTLSSFTSEANLTAGDVRPILPAKFFSIGGDISKVITFEARGILSTTGTPTFQLNLNIGTSTTWASSDTVLAQTTTMTTQSGVTNAHWWLVVDVMCLDIGFSGMSLSCAGMFFGPGAVATPFAYAMAPSIGTPATWTVSSLDSATTYSPSISAVCGTSSASNTITCKQFLVHGRN